MANPRDASEQGSGHEDGLTPLDPITEGGRFAEVLADAMIAWALLVRAVMERLDA